MPAAAVYDLGRGDGTLHHPGPELGLAAYRSAREEGGDRAGVLGGRAPVRGSVGGGTGAFTGRGLLRGGDQPVTAHPRSLFRPSCPTAPLWLAFPP